MFVKLLSLLDLCAALVLLFGSYFPKGVLLYCFMYLLVKGILFVLMGNKMSFVDIFSGVYVMAMYGLGIGTGTVSLILALYFAQKGIVGML